jgi:hypothetical protein
VRSTIAIIAGFALLIFCSIYVTSKINNTSENILAQLSEAVKFSFAPTIGKLLCEQSMKPMSNGLLPKIGGYVS